MFDSNTPVLLVSEEVETPIYTLSKDPGTSLENTFARPYLIGSYSWGSSFTTLTLNPYSYLKTVPIWFARMNYYRNFRANAHVRFVLNGSPFHYGRLIAAWFPLVNYTNCNYSAYITDTIRLAQNLSIQMDPSQNSEAELVIPFISQQPFINLCRNTTLLTDMGALAVAASVPLAQVGQSTPQAIEFSVYVWFTEVDLRDPTIMPFIATSAKLSKSAEELGVSKAWKKFVEHRDGLTRPPSSGTRRATNSSASEFKVSTKGKKSEATGKGPITQVASIVSNVSAKLTDVPVIGSYARATQMGAELIGKLAALFGFSKPNMPEIIERMLNRYTGPLAAGIGRDTTLTLTLDPNAELSIAPSDVGFEPEDDMAFASIITRWGPVATFNWVTTNASGVNIYQAPVTPFYVGAAVGSTQTMLTPLAHVASLFKYWRGSMKFRLDFVCNAMLRGRVSVRWQPSGTPGTSGGFNQPIMPRCILDLSVNRTIDFEIGWGRDSLMIAAPQAYADRKSVV